MKLRLTLTVKGHNPKYYLYYWMHLSRKYNLICSFWHFISYLKFVYKNNSKSYFDFIFRKCEDLNEVIKHEVIHPSPRISSSIQGIKLKFTRKILLDKRYWSMPPSLWSCDLSVIYRQKAIAVENWEMMY